MKKTNKKPIIALAVLAMVGAIGGAIAYFTSEAIFKNEFETERYHAEFTETFTSPDPTDPNSPKWEPGSTVDKVVEVKNTGNIDLAVRVSYVEEWKPIEGANLSNTLADGTTRVVQLNGNLTDATKWKKVGTADNTDISNPVTYYYYLKKVKKGETARFLDSVTYNKNVNINYDKTFYMYYKTNPKDSSETPTEVEVVYNETTKDYDLKNPTTDASKIEGKTQVSMKQVYDSEKTGYAGAKYTLTIKVETVQFDSYKQAWPTAPEISAE